MRFVQREDVRIAYEALGEGPAVVLLHSFLCSGAMWRNQVTPLAARHLVVNVDGRGHGASSRISRPFSLYDMADDALAVLDALGIDRAVWAGLSIGGMIALRAALRAPGRVNGLLLVDTDAGPERLWSRLKYRALGALVRILGMRPVLPQVARQMFGPTTERSRPDLVAEWAERFAGVDVPSALVTLRALNEREDLLPRLAEIDAPALVLVGAEDRSLPPERSRRLARGLSGSRLIEIPGAGHLSALEQPDAVTSAMLEFLRDLEGTARPTGGPTSG